MGAGGAETMIMNIYRNIDRSKIQFDFLVHTKEQSFYDTEIEQLGGNIYHISKYNIINYIDYKRSVDGFMESHPEIQIVHGHINSSAFVYLKSAKKNNKATVLHCHASKRTDKSFRAIAFEISAWLVRKIPDYYLACSSKAGSDRFGRKIVKRNNFMVLENGINPHHYKYDEKTRNLIREKFDISSDKIIVGHVGRFTHAKNHQFILDVFEKFHIKHPNSLLWLIGDGELKEEIERKAKTLSCSDDIYFLGVKDNVSRFLQTMDVFLFPSVFEGLGISLIEAQAAGLPCLASENIQNEANMNAGLLYQMSLNDSLLDWSEKLWEILNLHKNRIDTSKYIKDSGFDILDSAMKITKIYTDLLR